MASEKSERPHDSFSALSTVEELIAACVRRVPDEGPRAIESVCRDHPEHAIEVRAGIERLRDAGVLEVGPPRDERSFPDRLGEFRLLERIGGGGMGVVYLAEQETLKRRVALKLIRPEHLYFPGSRERFRREIESIARLQHPGIVPIHTVGEADGIPYFAMEFVDGCSLTEVLHHLGGHAPERLSSDDLSRAVAFSTQDSEAASVESAPASPFRGTWPEACLRLVRDVAVALEHAHTRGIVHRDVKPSNIAITRSGRAVLLDFGLARAGGMQKITRTGSELGSLAYMSPEQVRGDEAALGPRTDVYSLGVTLYELLTLRVPYLSETTDVTRQLILDGRPEAPRARNRAVPRDAEIVCLKAIEPDPARRYGSAEAFARDIENVLEHRPIEARRPPMWLRARRWTQRHPARAAAVTAALLIGAGSIFVAYRESTANREIRRLSDLQEVKRLVADAEAFWPADPEKLPAINRWVDEASAVCRRRDGHQATLEALRRRALPYSDEMEEADQRPHREKLAGFQGERQRLLAYFALSGTREKLDDRMELARLDMAIPSEERAITQRRTWLFSSRDDQWQHDTLSDLVFGLESLATLASKVSRQRQATEDLERETLIERRSEWEEACADIATSDTYGHLNLAPQLGLLPLGKNGQSGLWEFLFVPSGRTPVSNPTPADPERLRVDAGSGIVLVLLPGGSFRIGSVAPSCDHPPGSPNVDPWSQFDESPIHTIRLAPFFLSKYEMTLGQWKRIREVELEHEYLDNGPETLPAWVSWSRAARSLPRRGLRLPTEAQWEYACRAGTTTVFCTGDAVASLQGFANVADRAVVKQGWEASISPEIDDGQQSIAPVGSYLPSAFGLYDVHGNVREICADVWVQRGYTTVPARDGDGLRYVAAGGSRRAVRGGSCALPAGCARSASRADIGVDDVLTMVGVRPARSIDP